jgi:hypothetical protein
MRRPPQPRGDSDSDSPTGGWQSPSPLRPPDDGYPEPAGYDPPAYEPVGYETAAYDQPRFDLPAEYEHGEEQQYAPEQYEEPAQRPAEHPPYGEDQFDEEELPRVRSGRRASPVRPYVRTAGRTRSSRELALETLVSVSRQRPRGGRPANREYRRVVDLCDVPRSIAEVAALTAVPVGVARVLVGDLAAQGVLTVHQTRGPSGAATDMALMQRVLAGLRNL